MDDMDELDDIGEEEEELPESTNEPSKPSNPLKRAATTTKTAVNATVKISDKIIRFFASPVIPIPVKIGVILVIIIIAVILVLDADADDTSTAVTDSLASYIESSEVDKAGKELFLEKASLMKMPLKDINNIYLKFKESNKFATVTVNNYDYILGTKDVQEGGEVTSSEEVNLDYNKTYTKGQDGVRDDSRVEIITGSKNRIKTYMTGNGYKYSNGSVGGVKVDLVDVQCNVWKSGGSSKSVTIQINSKIANVVKAMMDEIYNHPSHPIIDSIAGFRDSDGYPTHVFGVAIDINPDQNPMPGSYGSIADYKPGSDSRSMDANHPIVKIIKDKYGWAWGGDFSGTKDYMHFSFIGG